MKIPPKKAKETSPTEQIVMAEVAKVTFEPPEGAPEECVFHFRNPAWKELIPKSYPARLDLNSPLARVVAVIRGKRLTHDELQDGYDPSELARRMVPVLLGTRGGSGGRLVPEIIAVFDLKALKADVAALEEPAAAKHPPGTPPELHPSAQPPTAE